jgi:integrating conjugative element protein (TIGR03756 family)
MLQNNLFKKTSLSALILLSSFNVSSVSAETFNTIDAMKASINLDCIDYCITGVCIHIICSPWGCDFDWSFLVSHNLPELIVSVYDEIEEQPYDEYRPFQEMILSSFGNKGASLAIPEKVGSKPVVFKNASIVGHPFMMFFQGANSAEEDSPDDSSDSGGIEGVADNSEPENSEEWMAQQSGNVAEQGSSSGMDSELSAIGGSSSFEGFCAAEVTPFMPYYDSAIDSFEWRYAVVDRIVAVMNNAHIFGNREIGSMDSLNPVGENTWGGVYPRMGFVLQQEDPKAAAVIAQRAVDIVTRNDIWRFKIQTAPIGESNEKSDLWQMVSPKEDKKCNSFGSKDPDWSKGRNSDGLGQYGWNYWGRYTCCLGEWPILAKIPLTPLCLNAILG